MKLEGIHRHSLTEFCFMTEEKYEEAEKFFIEAGKKIDKVFFLMFAIEDLDEELRAEIEQAGFVVADNHPLRHPIFGEILKGTYCFVGMQFNRAHELSRILDNSAVVYKYCFYNLGIDYDSSMRVVRAIEAGEYVS